MLIFALIILDEYGKKIRLKAENVMLDPKGHIERCIEFGKVLEKQFPFGSFMQFIYSRYLYTSNF